MLTSYSSRQLYFRLLRYVRPYARQFAAGIGGMVAVALTEPAIPAVLKMLLDEGFVEKNLSSIHWILVMMVSLFLVRGIASIVSGLAIGWVAGRVELDVRGDMFDRLLLLPARFYDNNPTGNVISKVTYNVTQVTNAATKTLTVIVKDSVTVVGLLAYAIYLNWQLTLALFLAFPPVMLSVRAFARRMRRFSRAFQDSIGDMTHVLEEAVKGHKVIKVFGGQAWEQQFFHKVANRARQLQYKVIAARESNVPVVEFITAVLFSAVVYIGTRQAIDNELSVGGLVAFFAAIGLMTSPIKRLTNASAPLQKGLAAAESIFRLVDEEAEPERGQQELETVHGELSFRNVCFRYAADGEPVLRDISFEVPAGTTVALVGPSGSGKSTIASLLPRFYEPGEGYILLDGVDIASLSLVSLRRHIAFVSQDIVLFNDTLKANIAYGINAPSDDDAIIAAAKAANAWEFVRAMPQGLDTLVGENGVRLSGGQRQRLAIARAILKDAPVLILDEATSALDTTSEKLVQQALERIRQGRTTLVIAHRLSTIESADKVLVVDGGRIVESGHHRELIAAGGRYASLYQGQFVEPAAPG
jgi:subfamily B ATP-binding cassette protein MsbA